MPKNFVSNSHESTRMFKSNFMESLSKVHFSVPLFIYVPVILFFFYKAFFVANIGTLPFFGYLLLGIFVWSLAEYLLHRFVFHFVPKSKWGLRLHFVFHGVHHDYPNDMKRLVMPPSVSIPLAFLFYFIFSFILTPQHLYAFFPGFVIGYLFYDISHYALHHFNFKNKFWMRLKKHHMLHHYSDASKGYGVSSPFWDKIFASDFLKKQNEQ
jgi:sterol desaturase/sphingolipid hydroxylase (fatty acid hydroxylase superfamily)